MNGREIIIIKKQLVLCALQLFKIFDNSLFILFKKLKN